MSNLVICLISAVVSMILPCMFGATSRPKQRAHLIAYIRTTIVCLFASELWSWDTNRSRRLYGTVHESCVLLQYEEMARDKEEISTSNVAAVYSAYFQISLYWDMRQHMAPAASIQSRHTHIASRRPSAALGHAVRLQSPPVSLHDIPDNRFGSGESLALQCGSSRVKSPAPRFCNARQTSDFPGNRITTHNYERRQNCGKAEKSPRDKMQNTVPTWKSFIADGRGLCVGDGSRICPLKPMSKNISRTINLDQKV